MSETFSRMERLLRRGAEQLQTAAPDARGALDWSRRQRDRLAGGLPDQKEVEAWAQEAAARLPEREDIEAWARERVARFSQADQPDPCDLRPLEEALTGTVAAIRQQSDRRTRIFINAVVGKLSAAGAVGGVTGLIAALGTASTGTAIASLSGAAATSAQLYWIGSTIGLGVAAGGAILATTGVGVAIVAGALARRRLVGSARSDEDLQDEERAIVIACLTLAAAVTAQLRSGVRPSREEMRTLSEQALLPLVAQIDALWIRSSLPEGSSCRPFEEILAPAHRLKLIRCRAQIERIAAAAIAEPGAAPRS